MRIRSARRSDLPLLQDIERAAGEPFRDLGMAFVADDDPPPLELLDGYRLAGRCWVASDPLAATGDRPLGYVLADPVDDALHIEQVSVDPAAARRGIGRDLIAHLAALAATRGMAALTLTTFTDVPWNAPYYTRIGFRILTERELTGGLRAIRAEEAQHGLDRWPRVCMRRELAPAARESDPRLPDARLSDGRSPDPRSPDALPSGAAGTAKVPPMPDVPGAPDTSEPVAVSGGA